MVFSAYDIGLLRMRTALKALRGDALRPVAGLAAIGLVLILFFLGLRWAVEPAEPNENEPFPTLKLRTLSGSAFKLTPGTGKPAVLLVFTAECLHCRNEVRNLSSIAESMRSQILTIGLSLSELDATQSYLHDSPVRFPVFRLEGSDPVGWEQQRAVPGLYLVDADGRLRGRYVGDRSLESDKRIVEAFLGRIRAEK